MSRLKPSNGNVSRGRPASPSQNSAKDFPVQTETSAVKNSRGKWLMVAAIIVSAGSVLFPTATVFTAARAALDVIANPGGLIAP